jgi:uncharacterized membrane protein
MAKKMNVKDIDWAKKKINKLKKYLLLRFKNQSFWIYVASFLYLCLENIFGLNISPEKYTDHINTGLGLLVLYGIIKNPTKEEDQKNELSIKSVEEKKITKKEKRKLYWKNKFKNYGLWVAIGSLLILFLPQLGFKIIPYDFKIFIDAVLSILVIFGILNNPNTDSSGFGDDSWEDK